LTPNPPTILVCDDNPMIHESLGVYLDRAGFLHRSAFTGNEALRSVRERRPDLLVLDIMMPGLDGLSVCREIRKTDSVPIILLTARGEEVDRILGLELGADDYIVKPFSPREVVARIKAVLRRIGEQRTTPSPVLRFPSLEINLAHYKVSVDGTPVALTPKEVEILHFLASRPGQVFSREQILARVWGEDYFGDDRAVDTQIRRIRRKLPEEGVPWAVVTVYGVGYKFEVVP
jgi:two-component system, OmpR family, response regulator ResD